MKYQISVVLLVAIIAGCDNQNPSAEDLFCQLVVNNKKSCTPNLSLKTGELSLSANSQSFELTAQYEACFQTEKFRISGQYEQTDNNKIQNIELLAKQIVTINDGSVSEFPKTVGLVSLNVDSKKGHFVDIWTMILAKGHPSEGHTQAEVNCQIRSK